MLRICALPGLRGLLLLSRPRDFLYKDGLQDLFVAECNFGYLEKNGKSCGEGSVELVENCLMNNSII